MLLVQVLLVKYVQGLRSFTVGGGPNFSEGVHILQQNKFRGSLFIEKLVPGGTNSGGSIFTMTKAIKRMTAVESDSVKSARKAKDKLHKAYERASETCE